MSETSSFEIVGCRIEVDCSDPFLNRLIRTHWGQMADSASEVAFVVRARQLAKGGIRFTVSDGAEVTCSTPCEFLQYLEHELLIRVQRFSSELLFVHAAVVERDDRAMLLIANSGSGKSTLTWALQHHGWSYLSDELAPMELGSLTVRPYPRAIVLRHAPPGPYELPDGVLDIDHAMLIPVDHLPSRVRRSPYGVAVMVFVSHDPVCARPTLARVSPGEAATRLYANTLNQLAHPNAGLTAAAQLAKSVPSYVLMSGDLPATCDTLGQMWYRTLGCTD